MDRTSIFIIVRDDLDLAPLKEVTDGLLLGRLPACELQLNHPSVSRTHAGIKEFAGHFYLFNLKLSNPIKLNGGIVERGVALAEGDVIEIGPFRLQIARTHPELVIKVSLQIGVTAAETKASDPLAATIPQEQKKRRPALREDEPASSAAIAQWWEKRIREKIGRPSPLQPQPEERSAKARYNWTPTTDLAQPWPGAILVFAAAVVGLISVAGIFWYASAFSPGPISVAHAKTTLGLTPAIAVRTSASSCTSCHTLGQSMDANCSSCHQAQGFHASITQKHLAAGIGCTVCHAEHQGAEFRPRDAAFAACATCHNDANNKLYNGKQVATPHGGSFGYPRIDGQWVWTGLEPEELALKPEIARLRLATETEQQWRSKQFHAIHLYRVRAVAGIRGISSDGIMSCSSCHQAFGAQLDRSTPRTTCNKCHNGLVDERDGRILLAADAPDCTSCHVQHIYDKHRWGESLLTNTAHTERLHSIDQATMQQTISP